jgi:hypothetical protein
LSGLAIAVHLAEWAPIQVNLLLKYLPDPLAVEELLQLFQGAILVYLVTGDREQGRRALKRMIQREKS